jgi:hypothetical protein
MDAADNKSKRHAKGRGKSINAHLIFENQALLVNNGLARRRILFSTGIGEHSVRRFSVASISPCKASYIY